jgi:hypothetical protein
MVMKFGTWNASSSWCRVSEVAKCESELVAAREARRDTGGPDPADDTLFYGNGNANHDLGKRFFLHKGIRSAVQKAELISDSM